MQTTIIKPFLLSFQTSNSTCDALIDLYEDGKKQGLVGDGTNGGYGGQPHVDKSVKDSQDLGISWIDTSFGKDPRLQLYMKELQDAFQTYVETYPFLPGAGMWDMLEGFNIQKYPKGGGFKQYHTEQSSTVPQTWRQLVFMTYLNDCDPAQGGGTNFFYQGVLHPAIKGATLIWPAGFQWMHAGIPTQEKEKMIATGWWHCMLAEQREEFIQANYQDQLDQMEQASKQWTVSQADIKTDPKIKSYKPGEGVILKKSHNN